jgi:hypothetical protein
VYQQVVDVVGTPKVCKYVDSGTRSLVAKLLRETGGGSAEAAGVAGRAVANEVRQLCTSMTPEGRTVIVLTGAAATVVYGILNYEDLEASVQDAIRKAKIPVSVPLERARIPGKLTLSLGLEELGARYRVEAGPGRLDMRLQHDLDRGSSSFSANYNQPLAGGTFSSGVRHTTDGNTAVFFEFKMSF